VALSFALEPEKILSDGHLDPEKSRVRTTIFMQTRIFGIPIALIGILFSLIDITQA
jgi:hypothetical protein